MSVSAITSTTQDFLPVYDIRDDLVILKDGGVAMIIETTAVNFGLLSQAEQDAIIYAYAALLNSLNFSLQILIQSQQKDISSYLSLLDEAIQKQASPMKKQWITRYRTFVSETVRRRNVLDKKFYIIIPFFALELGTIKSLGNAIVAGKGKGADRLPAPLEEIVKKASTTLGPKRDHILRQLERIGLTAKQLKNRELLSLLYRSYNPGASLVAMAPEQFTAAMVEPLVEKKEEKQGAGNAEGAV